MIGKKQRPFVLAMSPVQIQNTMNGAMRPRFIDVVPIGIFMLQFREARRILVEQGTAGYPKPEG